MLWNELYAFRVIPGTGSSIILYVGTLIIELKVELVLGSLAFYIAQDVNVLYLILLDVFFVAQYVVVLIAAALWYFSGARKGICQGVILGVYCWLGWQVISIVDDAARDLIGYPSLVHHGRLLALPLLCVCFAALGQVARFAENHRRRPEVCIS